MGSKKTQIINKKVTSAELKINMIGHEGYVIESKGKKYAVIDKTGDHQCLITIYEHTKRLNNALRYFIQMNLGYMPTITVRSAKDAKLKRLDDLFSDIRANLDVSQLDTDFVQSMRFAFKGFSGVITGIDKWNTVRVRTMEGMFAQSVMDELNLESFRTQSVRNFTNMFYGARISYLEAPNFTNEENPIGSKNYARTLNMFSLMWSSRVNMPKFELHSYNAASKGHWIRMFVFKDKRSLLYLNGTDADKIKNSGYF